jgi:hypothetical protein
VAAAALTAPPPATALVTYPGAAPCDGTLQACIDGVAAGETIEIATATPILESLSIDKDLTVRSAAGVIATLLTEDPGQGTVLLSDAAGAVTVRLEGLRLVRTTVAVLGFADGSDFTVAGCLFLDDGGEDYAIDARLAAELSLLVERNQLEWTGPLMLVRTSGSQETDVVGIVVRANSMTSNTSGPILGPSASGPSVEAIGRSALGFRFDSNLLVDLAPPRTGAPPASRSARSWTSRSPLRIAAGHRRDPQQHPPPAGGGPCHPDRGTSRRPDRVPPRFPGSEGLQQHPQQQLRRAVRGHSTARQRHLLQQLQRPVRQRCATGTAKWTYYYL